MTVPPHDVELLLGGYVLGALSPAEDRQVAAHLPRCGACRAAYLDLSEVPALFALFGEQDLLGDDGPAP
ncbi:zf-HC2 domain-containing protein [Streptomyces sp. NPDC051211]|uniref:zf-HC2 domain-containing protein n=1 Tax=Streptomyces sp. NPDC051211 TaxID=3154643 RepID=UPI00344B4073